MHQYSLIIILLFMGQLAFGQEDYQLSGFGIAHDAVIAGQGSHTKGLDIQFRYTPKALTGKEHNFSIELESKDYIIGKQSKAFTYTCSDSLAYLIDSLGIDSIPNLDTIVHIYIPYRAIDAEAGTHNITLSFFVEGKDIHIHKRRFRFQQVKVYDLSLDLQEATILPDSNANPLGLNYTVPDPKWLVKIGVDETLHGLVSRNSFQPKGKKFTTTISNFDTVQVCIYNADPSDSKFLGCYTVEHGSDNYNKKYSFQAIGNKIEDAKFEVNKIERIPPSSNFQITENYDYKNIKGIKIDFNYGLPMHYKRRKIRINISDERQAKFDNIIELDGNRREHNSRIKGTYSYFIAYYNLQESKRIKLVLTGNDKSILEHETADLDIAKTIEGLGLEQKVGHIYKGISGILYEITFHIPQFPQGAQLKLEFPTLSQETKEKLLYWNESQPSKVQKGSHRELPALQNQTIFVFLPYFVAPKRIHLTPKLTIEAIDVPPIVLAKFESEEYACPSGLNDIQIQTTSNEEHNFTGLAGQLFRFNTTVPDYYHSKGIFELQILEDGQAMEADYFINKDVYEKLLQPIHNQKQIEVFIPYRFMTNGATYEVLLQAKNNDFALSEARKETFVNANNTVQTIGLYLARLVVKDWKEVVYKIGIRNNKNMNTTYEHLGYKTILQDTVKGNYKPDIPKAAHFEVSAQDEIVIWIKEKDMRDDQAIRLKTSLDAMQQESGTFTVKNQDLLKQVVFKLTSNKGSGRF